MGGINGLSPGDVVAFEQRLRSGNFKECLITEIDLSKPIPITLEEVESGNEFVSRQENIRATLQ